MLRTMLARLRAAWRGLAGKEAGAAPTYHYSITSAPGDPHTVDTLIAEIERRTWQRNVAAYGHREAARRRDG